MSTAELFIILLVIVVTIPLLAQRLNIAYPIALVLGGALIAFFPGLPQIPLDPELIFLIFLPPLLTEAAYFTSIHDLRSNKRPISFLAVGLVVVTSFVVAWVTRILIPETSWATGFVLGAVVSPTDAIAITTIARKIHMPKRVIVILEGESLTNDAAALVVYKFAIAAVLTGTFSITHASAHFIWMSITSIGIGLFLGKLFIHYFHLVREPHIAITNTFLIPFVAYLCGEFVHGSGVLAVVTVGLIIGWYAPEKFSPNFRIRANAVWQMISFLLNGFAFVLIGLQLPEVLHKLTYHSKIHIVKYSIAITFTIIIVRFIWVFAVTYGTRFFFPSIRKADPYPPWQNAFVIAWCGMRGVVSLAAALALPIFMNHQQLFPQRDLIIYLAFVVIFVTLVIQGLLTPFVIKKLNFPVDPHQEWQRWRARQSVTLAALDKIDELSLQKNINKNELKLLRTFYEERLANLGSGPASPIEGNNQIGHSIQQKIGLNVINAERKKLLAMRYNKEINEGILRELLIELDFAHAHYEKRFHIR